MTIFSEYLFIISTFISAMTSNPWTIATAIEEDVEAAYAGYSIDAQQTACISSFGGDQVNAAA